MTPAVQVWVNGDSDENIGKLAASLDKQISKKGSKQLKAFIVFIPKKGEDTAALETRLQKLSDANKLQDTALIYVTGPEDSAVEDYRINVAPEVKNTVLVYRYHKVTKNFVNLKGDENGTTQLDKAIDEMMAEK